MAYEWATKTTDSGVGIHWDDPVVVLVVTGTHDVSRIVQCLRHGNSEQAALGTKIAKSLQRNTTGQRALELLRRHGGEDLTALEPDEDPVDHLVRHFHERYDDQEDTDVDD